MLINNGVISNSSDVGPGSSYYAWAFWWPGRGHGTLAGGAVGTCLVNELLVCGF